MGMAVMGKATLISAVLTLAIGFPGLLSSDAGSTELATLYSPNKYPRLQQNSCVNLSRDGAKQRLDPCDLVYGSLYAGDDWDWFQSSQAPLSRSVIKDLGQLTWNASFTVPVVAPFPKLGPGEQRHFTVDVSGADGVDGADGAPGRPGADGAGAPVKPRADAEGESSNLWPPRIAAPRPQRPRNDGKPKIDPVYVKAMVGHLYVIHVVDEASDFYALFRVESLERGDHCTISWKLIPAPADQGPLARSE